MLIMNTQSVAMGACAGLLGVLSIVSVAFAQVAPPPPQPIPCACFPVVDCWGNTITSVSEEPCEPWNGEHCECVITWHEDEICIVAVSAECWITAQ